MKVKRFNNLWAMGLILFGALLIAFYVTKIFFPQFIVGVAQTPNIVKFGNYVDRHKWAKVIFNIVTSFTLNYIYFCACCRTFKLNKKQFIILLAYIVIIRLTSKFLPTLYIGVNISTLVFVPFLMCYVNDNITKETFISTALCFTIDIVTQYMSLVIRDITKYVSCVNSATFFVLLIDALIWRLLLCCYFNFKKER
jgi:hypothetical protein